MPFDQHHESIDLSQKRLSELEPVQKYKDLWSKKVNKAQEFCNQKAAEIEDTTAIDEGLEKIATILVHTAFEGAKETHSEGILRNLMMGLEQKIEKIERGVELQEMYQAADILLGNEPASKPSPTLDPGADLNFDYPQFEAERMYGFAETPSRNEFQGLVDSLQTEDEKKAFITSMMDTLSENKEVEVQLTEQQSMRLEQLQLFSMMMQMFVTEFGEHSQFLGSQIRNKMDEIMGIDTRGSADLFKSFISEEQLQKYQYEILLNPNASLKDIIPVEAFALIELRTASVPREVGSETGLFRVAFRDPSNRTELHEKKLNILNWFRFYSHYGEVKSIIEDDLAAEIKASHETLGSIRAGLDVYEEVAVEMREMKAENIDRWRSGYEGEDGKWVSAMSEQQIKFFMERMTEESQKQKLLSYALEHEFDHKSLPPDKRELWDIYNDTFHPRGFVKDPFNLGDSTWDTIQKELMINAPLIMVSGGVASLVKTGISKAALWSAGRMGLLTGLEIAYEGSRIIRAGAFVGLTLTEGVAFEAVHSVMLKQIGFEEEWLGELNLPQAMQRIFWSTVTLGLFHGAGKLGEGMGKGLGQAAKKQISLKFLSKISHPGTNRLLQQVLIAGNLEAFTMLLMGAVQTGLYEGSIEAFFEQFSSSDAIFHAYLAAYSLKAGHGATQVFKPITGRSKSKSAKKPKKAKEAKKPTEAEQLNALAQRAEKITVQTGPEVGRTQRDIMVERAAEMLTPTELAQLKELMGSQDYTTVRNRELRSLLEKARLERKESGIDVTEFAKFETALDQFVTGQISKAARAKESATGYDHAAEFARILKMPNGPAKTEAIARAREKRDTQRVALAEVPGKIREFMRENPEALHPEVWEHILGGESADVFSQSQRVWAKEQALQYVKRHNDVREFARDYVGRGKELAALIFDREVSDFTGKIEVEVYEDNLFINFKNAEDFTMFSGSDAHRVGGLALKAEAVHIAELRGAIIVGNNVTGGIHDLVIVHEARHKKNAALLTDSAGVRRHSQMRERSGEEVTSRSFLREVQDEVIAYVRDGTQSKETVLKFLTEKDGTYDYYSGRIKDTKNEIATAEASSNTEAAAAAKAELAGLEAQRGRHFEKTKRLVDIGFEVGREYVDLLAMTPFEHWRKLVEGPAREQGNKPNPEGAKSERAAERGVPRDFVEGEVIYTSRGQAEVLAVNSSTKELTIKFERGGETHTETVKAEAFQEMIAEGLSGAIAEGPSRGPNERTMSVDGQGYSSKPVEQIIAERGFQEAIAGQALRWEGVLLDHQAIQLEIQMDAPVAGMSRMMNPLSRVKARGDVPSEVIARVESRLMELEDAQIRKVRQESGEPSLSQEIQAELLTPEVMAGLPPKAQKALKGSISAYIGLRRNGLVTEVFRKRAKIREGLSEYELSLPKASQKALVNERLRQASLLDATNASLISEGIEGFIKQNPDASYQEIMGVCFPKEYQALLPSRLKQAIKKDVYQILQKRETVRKHTEGLTPVQIAEKLFSFTPEGEVRVFVGQFSIVVDFVNPADYARAFHSDNPNPTVSDMGAAKSSGGLAFERSPNPKLPELAEAVIIGKNQIGQGLFEGTLIHEVEHQTHRMMRKLTERNRAFERIKGTYTDVITKDGLRDMFVGLNRDALTAAQTEILAYTVQGYDASQTTQSVMSKSYEFTEGKMNEYVNFYTKEGRQEVADFIDNEVYPNARRLYRTQVEAHTLLAEKLLLGAGSMQGRRNMQYQLAATKIHNWPRMFPKEWAEIVNGPIRGTAIERVRGLAVNSFVSRKGVNVKDITYETSFYERQYGLQPEGILPLGGTKTYESTLWGAMDKGVQISADSVVIQLRALVAGGIVTPKAAQGFLRRLGDRPTFESMVSQSSWDRTIQNLHKQGKPATFDALLQGDFSQKIIVENSNPNTVVAGEMISGEVGPGYSVEGVVIFSAEGANTVMFGTDSNGSTPRQITLETQEVLSAKRSVPSSSS